MIHTVENCNARSARALYRVALYRVAGAHTGAQRVVRGQRMLEGHNSHLVNDYVL